MRGVASADRVAVGLDVDAVAAVTGEEMAAAGDLAVGFVGDACFDDVILVGVALGVVDFGLDGDGELAVGVELAGLLGLLAGVVHLVIGGLVLVVGAHVAGLIFFVAPPIMRLVIDAVLHFAEGDGLAEEVA